jgi:molecular chaperone GrpE
MAAEDEPKPPRTGQGERRIIIPGERRQDIDELMKERDEYLETARRARADYTNLQRRLESEYAAAREETRSQFALDMLVILDDLERALDHAREGEDYGGLVEGIALVREKFLAILARYGIRPIEALNAPFDHNSHDAIAHEPAGDAAPGTVTAVAQTGYMIGDKLLRPARVVVARAAEQADGESSRAGENEDERME